LHPDSQQPGMAASAALPVITQSGMNEERQ